MMEQKTVQVIIGPTASGKSAFAIKEASASGGVIINCDAMQCYDALHVLAAQPEADDLAQVPHRLYAHLHPSEHYSAAEWRNDAITEIKTAFENGQTPIICGGTGFYLKALTEGLSPIPEIPEYVRAAAVAFYEEVGIERFHEELKRRDPLTASVLDPMNPARNIRAWEVLDYTGRPLAEWQKQPLIGPPQDWNFFITGLHPNRDRLVKRIEQRLNTMVQKNILDEVRALDSLIMAGEVPENALITKAHGFVPLRRHLRGEISLEQALDLTLTETRQYAKRQVTWIRNQLSADRVIESE